MNLPFSLLNDRNAKMAYARNTSMKVTRKDPSGLAKSAIVDPRSDIRLLNLKSFMNRRVTKNTSSPMIRLRDSSAAPAYWKLTKSLGL